MDIKLNDQQISFLLDLLTDVEKEELLSKTSKAIINQIKEKLLNV